jgi:hypothetical protein
MERWDVSAARGITSEVSIYHLFPMGECPSLKAKRDSSHEEEKFLLPADEPHSWTAEM